MATEKRIRTLSGFIKWVETLNPTGGEVLYRGLSSNDYLWDSSIARRIKNTTKKEPIISDIWLGTLELIKDAKRQGYDRDPTRRGEAPARDFEILALLQHHKAATPLMDFSHNPLVALWFACQSNPKKDGRIITIASNDIAKVQGSIDIKTDSINLKGIKQTDEESPLSTDRQEKILNTQDNLWRFNPPGFDARILAQNSEFILGKVALKSNDILETCVISKSAKERIRQQLKLYGISEARLFRDFTGYALINSPENPIKTADEIAAEYHRKGIMNLQKNEIDEAVSNFIQSVNLTLNKNPEYILYLGIAYSRKGKNEYDKAIHNFTKVIKLKSDYIDAYNLRAIVYRWKNEHDKAIADYDKIIKSTPDDAETYINRGTVYRNKNDYDKSIADYDKSIELNPNNANAYINLGLSYSGKKEYEKAIAEFNKAIELDPNYVYAYFHRGIAYNNKKEYEKAIADYDKSIELNPNAFHAYLHRGISYRGKGEYEKAFADFNKSIELNPNNNNPYFHRGIIYRDKGEYEKAIAEFNKAIELDLNDAYTYFQRGIAKKALQNNEEAKQDFQTALKFSKQQENKDLAARIQKFIDALPADPN